MITRCFSPPSRHSRFTILPARAPAAAHIPTSHLPPAWPSPPCSTAGSGAGRLGCAGARGARAVGRCCAARAPPLAARAPLLARVAAIRRHLAASQRATPHRLRLLPASRRAMRIRHRRPSGTSSCESCSGLMYGGVPTCVPTLVTPCAAAAPQAREQRSTQAPGLQSRVRAGRRRTTESGRSWRERPRSPRSTSPRDERKTLPDISLSLNGQRDPGGLAPPSP